MDVDITESVWRRGWEDSKRGWTDWRFVVADMVALPLLAFFVSVPVALVVAALSLFTVWVGATASAPFRQRNEARDKVFDLLATRDRKIEAVSSYPHFHTETGVPPLGEYLVIPVTIYNRGDSRLDCDLGLDVTVEARTYMLSLENSEIANLPSSLPTTLRGQAQLTEPLVIERQSRAVGSAVFESSILPDGTLEKKDLAVFDKIVLTITDGVEHTEVCSYEVWPSIWPEMFERAHQEVRSDG